MQFKVPQNVQMEDKIVGSLTLKQMIILGAGGGVSYVVYIALARTYYWEVWIAPLIVVMAITCLFAFGKFYNLTFSRFILLWLQHLLIPRQRIWIKKSGDVEMQEILTKISTEVDSKAKKKSERAAETIKKLKNISTVLDSYGKTK
jgi:hypothetical protein